MRLGGPRTGPNGFLPVKVITLLRTKELPDAIALDPLSSREHYP